METISITARELVATDRIVVGPYDYGITEIETLDSGSLAITIDTGYCQVLQPEHRVQIIKRESATHSLTATGRCAWPSGEHKPGPDGHCTRCGHDSRAHLDSVCAGDTLEHSQTGERYRVVSVWRDMSGKPTLVTLSRGTGVVSVEVWRDEFPAYRVARMEITPRVVSDYTYRAGGEQGPGFGTCYCYRRTINGTPYAFTFVIMPSGERRHFVSRYNGYCRQSIDSGLMTWDSVLRFACAWTQVHAITVPTTN